MKYIFLMMSILLSLHADIDKIQMYAKVKATSADLYHRPYECSKKKHAFFRRGDMIKIEYCNKYKWCKTTHGFVKKDLLILPEPLRKENYPIPNPIMIPRKIKPVQKVEIIAEPVIVQENNESKKIIEVTPHLEKKLDAYDEYFKESSTKIIFKEQ